MNKFKVEIPDFDYWQRLIPCQAASETYGCPVNTDARGYVRAIAEGRYAEAYAIARGPNPFASICGRVCGAPCEKSCRRGEIDDKPIGIRALKRFVTEQYGSERNTPSGKESIPSRVKDFEADPLEEGVFRGMRFGNSSHMDVAAIKELMQTVSFTDQKAKNTGHKVAIIGAGCAGLTAAHDLALMGYRVTVFEKAAVGGGMLSLGVPVFRLPRDLVQAEIEVVKVLGVDIKYNMEVGKDFLISDLKKEGFEAFIIAIGLHVGRPLPIEGKDLHGVKSAVQFLANYNTGIFDEVGKKVVIIGGGDVAMDAARCAARMPVRKEGMKKDEQGREVFRVEKAVVESERTVHLLCLESWDILPASPFEVRGAMEEGIRINPSYGPNKFIGKDGKLAYCEFKAVKSIFDESGRFNPSYYEDKKMIVEADTVILAIGQMSDNSFLRDEDGVELTPRGIFKLNPETGATTAPEVFCAGDVATGPKLFINAVEQGHRVSRSVHEFFTKKKIVVKKTGRMEEVECETKQLKIALEDTRHLPIINEDYCTTWRDEPSELHAEERIGDTEIELGYGEKDALLQGSRCLICSTNTIFDSEKCIMCNGCVDVCPEYCLRLVRLEDIEGDEALQELLKSRFGKTQEELAEETQADLNWYEDLPWSSGGSVMLKDETRCIRCSSCEQRCPTDTITMEKFSFKEELVYE